jgi:cell division protein FtsZ
MSINLTVPKDNSPNLQPKLTVIGVGGAGGNAVNNMIRSKLEGVDFIVANTDAQSLSLSGAEHRIQLGARLTEGLGAGSKPEIGRGAAEESLDEIIAEIDGAHMAFIAAGMGGGTGTGGAPVIARAAKERGILTVGVVTKPFQFEGSHRMKQADEGIEILEQFVDTLIVIPNQNLFRIANEKTTFADAFSMADEVLYSGVRGVTDLMVMPGLINLDFADIRSVMSQMGKAMMGNGEAAGERRALDAAEAAIANPLLDDTSMKGAKGVLINITGGVDITLFEVDEAANRIRAEVDDDANIMVGSAFDESLEGIMRVSVVATGIDISTPQMVLPTMLHLADKLDSSVEAKLELEVDIERHAPVSEKIMLEEAIKTEVIDSTLETETEVQFEKKIEPISELEPEILDKDEKEKEVLPENLSADDSSNNNHEAKLNKGTVDAFIPPQPVVAEELGVQEKMTTLHAAPDATDKELNEEIKVSNEVPQIPWRMKGVSLFERVTGSGKSSFIKKDDVPEVDEVKQVPSLSGLQVTEKKPDQIKLTDEIKDLETGKSNTLNVAVETVQSDVIDAPEEYDEQEAVTGDENADDLLDIPAFLRRQAN